MLVAKSVKSVSGKVVVFVNDERGRNSVSVFERHKPEAVVSYEALNRKESIDLTNKLSMVV